MSSVEGLKAYQIFMTLLPLFLLHELPRKKAWILQNRRQHGDVIDENLVKDSEDEDKDKDEEDQSARSDDSAAEDEDKDEDEEDRGARSDDSDVEDEGEHVPELDTPGPQSDDANTVQDKRPWSQLSRRPANYKSSQFNNRTSIQRSSNQLQQPESPSKLRQEKGEGNKSN